MASSDFRRERAAHRMIARSARHSRAARGSARDLTRSPKTAKAAEGCAEHSRSGPSHLPPRKPSRACAQFASRYRPSARNAHARGRRNAGIGHRTLQRRYGGAGSRVTGRSMERRPRDRERRVLDALHRAAVFCDQRIGWNRIGLALSIAIIAVAAVALHRILPLIDAREVVGALVNTELRNIMLGAVFVAGGDVTLTFYDLVGVRTIGGKDAPYRAAALAAFTSYAVGHNVGASVFTGG